MGSDQLEAHLKAEKLKYVPEAEILKATLEMWYKLKPI